MIKFLKRTVRRWAFEKDDGSKSVMSIRESDRLGADPTLTFKIYTAHNGKIVEFTKYDNRTDRYDNQTYVLHKDDDIGDKIAKFVNLELLR